MIPTSVLVKLATLGLSAEQAAAVGDMLSQVETATKEAAESVIEKSREKARARLQKWKDKQPENVSKRFATAPNVSQRLTGAEGSSDNLVISGKKDIRSPAAPSKKGERIPDDFQPDIEWAVSAGLTASQAKTEAAQFIDYWRGKPGKEGLKLDWPGTWRMWVRNFLKRNPPRTTDPPKPSRPRNAGELARMQLREMGMIPDAADNEKRHLGKSDGGANPPVTGLARRFAVAAN